MEPTNASTVAEDRAGSEKEFQSLHLSYYVGMAALVVALPLGFSGIERLASAGSLGRLGIALVMGVVGLIVVRRLQERVNETTWDVQQPLKELTPDRDDPEARALRARANELGLQTWMGLRLVLGCLLLYSAILLMQFRRQGVLWSGSHNPTITLIMAVISLILTGVVLETRRRRTLTVTTVVDVLEGLMVVVLAIDLLPPFNDGNLLHLLASGLPFVAWFLVVSLRATRQVQHALSEVPPEGQ